MSTVVATQRSTGVRTVGLITIIAGVFMIVAGGVTWGAVATNLNNENITVSGDAPRFAGQQVNNPWTAFAQADIINHHALDSSGGETYATLGAVVNEHKAEAKAAVGGDPELEAMIDSLDVAGLEAAGAPAAAIDHTQQAAAAQGMRTTQMNASFLRASLFTSVVAFGVAALVVGLGVLFVLVGWAVRRLGTGNAVELAAPVTVTSAQAVAAPSVPAPSAKV